MSLVAEVIDNGKVSGQQMLVIIFIAANLDMSANFYIFALPMAIGGLFACRLHIR